MAFSIRLTEEEKSLADSYAKLNSMSLGEAFKKALFEKIEDEYDIKVGETAERKVVHFLNLRRSLAYNVQGRNYSQI